MKRKIIYFPMLLIICLFSPIIASGKTTFTITPNTSVIGPTNFIEFRDKEGTEAKFESLLINFFELNKKVLPTGMANANTLGYPNGKSAIKEFPHIELGVAAGASIYKLKRKDEFNKDNFDENPVTPGAGVNGGFHIGTGVTDRIDVTGKFFNLKTFYTKRERFEKEDDTQSYDAKLTDASVYSFGVKPRYNLVKKSKSDSILFNFGGVSVNLGLDYMYSRIAASVDYEKTVTDVEFKMKDPFNSSNEITDVISLRGHVIGEGEIKTSIFSITPEIFVYADILHVFSFYTGPSLSYNTGYMEFNIETSGAVKNTEQLNISAITGDFVYVAADQEIGSARFVSKNKMHPEKFIPKWTLGLELNLWIIKLQFETSTILTSATDSFTGQIGVRVDF